jgi:hypothetical protein
LFGALENGAGYLTFLPSLLVPALATGYVMNLSRDILESYPGLFPLQLLFHSGPETTGRYSPARAGGEDFTGALPAYV